MAFTVINGVPRPESKGLVKRRVTFVCFPTPEAGQPPIMQLISSMMMLRQVRAPTPGVPSVYEGPVDVSWANLKHTYPEDTAHLSLIGVLVAELGGKWAGHTDWVKQITREAPSEPGPTD